MAINRKLYRVELTVEKSIRYSKAGLRHDRILGANSLSVRPSVRPYMYISGRLDPNICLIVFMSVLQGVQKKMCFFTIHCNPTLAYIPVRDLQSSQRDGSVQSLLNE